MFRSWSYEYRDKGSKRAAYYVSWLGLFSEIEGRSFLDLGCGYGDHSTEVDRRGGVTIALEIDSPKLARAREQMPSSVHTLLGDATKIPIRDDAVDVVFSYDLYEHIKNREDLISEKFRVAKEEGLVACSTGNKLFPRDRHTGLFFIDLLPEKVASAWVRKKGREKGYGIYQPTFFSLCRQIGKHSGKFLVDSTSIIDMFKKIYSTRASKIAKWFGAMYFLNHLGLFKLFTPKFFVVARACRS